MHPILFHLGRIPIPAYGLFSVLALLAAILVIRHYARREGLDPDRTMDAIVMTVAAGYFGARIPDIVLHWGSLTSGSGGLLRLFFSTGYMSAGVIVAVLFASWWFRRVKLPVLPTLDIVGLVIPVTEGVGRWGCFFSGCCYGKPTNLPWGVTFPALARKLHAGLPAVPVHPTQIYHSLNALAIFGILVLAYRRKRFHGQILTLCLALFGLTRFFLEMLRGDAADRSFLFGGRMSTTQLAGLILGVLAPVAYVALARRHRGSGEPDWQPAPARPRKAPPSRHGKKSRRRR